jgi:glucose/arabinose dehydrogenase
MIFMSISAPGSPRIGRAQDPNDYAGKTIRLRDDGSIRADNPFVDRRGQTRDLHARTPQWAWARR